MEHLITIIVSRSISVAIYIVAYASSNSLVALLWLLLLAT